MVFLGPPGTGKTHLSIGLGIRACQAGAPGAFATATQWVDRLADAHTAGRLQPELVRLGRYPLLVVDEVGYIPFEPEAANLFFQLVSSRYERASLIVTSNKPFGRWGEVFGDDVVAAATVQTCPGVAVLWADVPGPSYRVCSWPWTWQQFWRRSATSASGGLLSTAVATTGERMRACPRHVGHAGARRWAARVPSGL